MTEKEIQVSLLRVEAKRCGLDAPDSFWMAPVEVLADCYNGTGAEWMSKLSRKFLDFIHRELLASVMIHDYETSMSNGSQKGFKTSNKRFYANCRRQSKLKHSAYNPLRYVWLYKSWRAYRILMRWGRKAWDDAYNLKEKGLSSMKKLALIAVASISLAALSGCAGYKIKEDGSVETWGVLRTLTVKRELYESGKLKSEAISTDSQTKDILMGLNEFIDTAVNTAAKLKP